MNTSSTEFAIQITYLEPYVEEQNGSETIKSRLKSIVLTAVSEPTINASNTITEHPIVSGDMVSDHSYKNPITMSFRGKAAAFGNQGIVVDSQGITLADLEQLFFKLKNEAYLCEIIKINAKNSHDIRFSQYSNMVLNNLQIVENINSLDYTLTFRQVLTVDLKEAIVDETDSFLPSITEPQTKSFTDVLIDWDEVYSKTVSALLSFELVEAKFLEYIGALSDAAIAGIVGAVAGVAAGAFVTSALIKVGVIAASSGPWGWAIGAAVGLAVGFVWGLITAIKEIKKKKTYRYATFKKYENDEKNRKEVQRFSAFMNDIHNAVMKLNNAIKVYQVSSDDDQECMVSISDYYYIFTFTTNNTTGGVVKRCEIKAIGASETGSDIDMSEVQDVSSSPRSYLECTTSNSLFRAIGSGEYAHIIYLPEQDENGQDKPFKLSKCLIVASSIKPEDYNNALYDIIKNTLTY